jgi:putative resolvase
MKSKQTNKYRRSFVPPSKIIKKYHTSSLTLRRWAGQGRVDYMITPTGRYLYNICQVEQMIGQGRDEDGRKKICYARVSSAKQKEDLQKQVQVLKDKYPQHEIIQDIGSGVDFRREGFRSLLDQICEGLVSEVVIMHKDILCLLGYEPFEYICQKFDTKLLIHEEGAQDEWKCSEEEMNRELIHIIKVFLERDNKKQTTKKYKSTNQDDIH